MTKHKQWIFAALTLALAAAPFAGVFFEDRGVMYAQSYAAAPVITEIPDEGEEALPAFGTTPLKLGSSGQDVYELQGRLKHLGYYAGPIDSQFGAKTKNAVTWFQWKFGLKSDRSLVPKQSSNCTMQQQPGNLRNLKLLPPKRYIIRNGGKKE